MTNTYQFVTLESFKTRLGIEDDGLDDSILHILLSSNRQLSLELAPILGKVDLSGTDLFEDAVSVAHVYTRAMFEMEVNKQMDQYELYKKNYKDQLKTLKAAIIAGLPNRPDRSKIAIFSSDRANDRIVLPGFKFDTILD